MQDTNSGKKEGFMETKSKSGRLVKSNDEGGEENGTVWLTRASEWQVSCWRTARKVNTGAQRKQRVEEVADTQGVKEVFSNRLNN